MTSSSRFLAKHEVQMIEYQRTHPPAHLMSATVLFLTEDAELFSVGDHEGPLVVLDGTWSEAKKMYAQWSKSLELQPKYVNFSSPSIYPFRKNQQDGGYSTAEVVLNIEKQRLNAEQASELDAYYASYLRSAWATLNGHAP